MPKSITFYSAGAVLLATLSSGVSAQEAAVDCDTAEADIAHLQYEKKSTDERVAKGVFSVMPIGIALNVAASAAESGSHNEMEINEYNKRLSERIQEIKQACGIE